MTIQEISDRFGFSESSLITNFPRTAEAIEKKYGVVVFKYKKNGETVYDIKDGRADTIYEEPKGIVKISEKSLILPNYEFFSFIGIVMTPLGVFRGTKKEFLKYIGLPRNKKNLEMLNAALEDLKEKEFIGYDVDEDYVIIYVRRKVEKELEVGINMLRQCKRIADKGGKRKDKIAQLMKVWLAVQLCIENQPFTYEDIQKKTGLSYNQIRDVKKLLEQNDIFRTERAGSYYQCLGMNADLNVFYN